MENVTASVQETPAQRKIRLMSELESLQKQENLKKELSELESQELHEELVQPVFSGGFEMPSTPIITNETNNTLDMQEAPTVNTVSDLEVFNNLTPIDQQKAKQLANQLKENDVSSVISFGSNIQNNVSTFSQNVLKQAQAQDLGEVGGTLTELMIAIKDANPNELVQPKGMFGKLFAKVKHSIAETQAKYQSLGTGIDQIANKLNKDSSGLLDDARNLEGLYNQNVKYFETLQAYIGAGELKLTELRDVTIPNARAEASKNSENALAVQQVHDLESYYNRLDKRVNDFRITRQLTIQQAPQIRLIQNTNQELAEKIQSSITTAIPLWKNQVAIALTLLKQKDALASQKLVSDTTNDLLRKNSEMLKMSTIEAATENERSIIDIDTLKTTQQNIVDTLQETLRIQSEGRKTREQSKIELVNMENQMKAKLLEFSQQFD